MQNSMTVFTFFALDKKYPFWENVIQKNRIFQFKLKFGT